MSQQELDNDVIVITALTDLIVETSNPSLEMTIETTEELLEQEASSR